MRGDPTYCHVVPDNSKGQMRGDPTYSVMSPLTVQKGKSGVVTNVLSHVTPDNTKG